MAFGLFASGCVNNESSLFIKGVLKLEAGDCTASADASGTMLAGGIMDPALTNRYMAALLVGNQMVPRGDPDQVRTETARVSLRGAEVRLADSEGNPLDEFSVDGTGFVDPSGGETPGYGIMFATLIPDSGGLPSYVIANVKVFGRTLGGRELESNELAFPIEVCQQPCLISYPLEADDPSRSGYQCARAADGDLERPCFLGQDEPVDCRLCLDRPACAGL